jgi:hypothetical protein
VLAAMRPKAPPTMWCCFLHPCLGGRKRVGLPQSVCQIPTLDSVALLLQVHCRYHSPSRNLAWTFCICRLDMTNGGQNVHAFHNHTQRGGRSPPRGGGLRAHSVALCDSVLDSSQSVSLTLAVCPSALWRLVRFFPCRVKNVD